MLLEIKMHKIKKLVNFTTLPSSESKLLVIKEKIIKGSINNEIDFNMRLILKNSSLITTGKKSPNRYMAIKIKNNARGN